LTEWTAAGKVEERTATWARSELQPRNGSPVDGGMGGSRLPLVDAAESAAAIVDALDSQTLSGAARDRETAFADERATDGSPAKDRDVDRSTGRLNRDIC